MNIVNLIKSILTYTKISAQQKLATGGEDNQGEVFYSYSSMLYATQREEHASSNIQIFQLKI